MASESGSRPRILHVNTRLTEGGAARVATTLHTLLPDAGYDSVIAYGTGPQGSVSPDEADYGATRLARRANYAFNRLSHGAFGIELESLNAGSLKRLTALAESSDLVHLHAIHSYTTAPLALLEQLRSLRKPVVWTMHDQWVLTGRCALPGSCTHFERACTPCQNRKAYPPARLDWASGVFARKRRVLQSWQELTLVACAEWLEKRIRAANLHLDVRTVHNSIDPALWAALSERDYPSAAGTRRVLFINRDLRDSNKVDFAALKVVAELPQVELTVMGDHLPDSLAGHVRHVSASRDRSVLADELSRADSLLFTSTVDHYPLVVAEALAAGLSVDMRESDASNDFSKSPNVRVYGSTADLCANLAESRANPRPPTAGRDPYFAPARMVNEYGIIYAQKLTG